MALISFITLLLLGTFSLFYMTRLLSTKPEFLTKADDFINRHLEVLSVTGLGFGFITVLMAPIFYSQPLDMFTCLLAAVVLMIMTLPFAFENVVAKFNGRINEAILKEFRNFINWTNSQEKLVGYVGAGATLFLFAVLFR